MQIIVRQAMCIDWPLIANSDDQMQCFDLTFIYKIYHTSSKGSMAHRMIFI